jgi:hypothetical protein
VRKGVEEILRLAVLGVQVPALLIEKIYAIAVFVIFQ